VPDWSTLDDKERKVLDDWVAFFTKVRQRSAPSVIIRSGQNLLMFFFFYSRRPMQRYNIVGKVQDLPGPKI
jgi:hypothetical protein